MSFQQLRFWRQFYTIVIAPTIAYGLEWIQTCINMDHVLLKRKFKNVSLFVYDMCVLQRVKPLVDFGFPEDTTCLALLRFKLNNMLPNTEIEMWVRSSFVHHELILMEMWNTTNIMLKTYEDTNVMWRIYHHRITKGSIKFDAIISRYVDDIAKMLKHADLFISVLVFLIYYCQVMLLFMLI